MKKSLNLVSCWWCFWSNRPCWQQQRQARMCQKSLQEGRQTGSSTHANNASLVIIITTLVRRRRHAHYTLSPAGLSTFPRFAIGSAAPSSSSPAAGGPSAPSGLLLFAGRSRGADEDDEEEDADEDP